MATLLQAAYPRVASARVGTGQHYCDVNGACLTQVKLLGAYIVPHVDAHLVATLQNLLGEEMASNAPIAFATSLPHRWYDSARKRNPVEPRRFIMNAGRTTKQGQQINVGKDSPEYQAIVGTMTMHPDDMKAAGISTGGAVRVWSVYGEATFTCVEGKVPPGMIFVPYGPPTCRVMGNHTDGTGMPTSKGWEVEVEPINV